MEITKQLMDAIASYMNDEIREMIHGSTEDPLEFLELYLDEDPDFSKILYFEFREVHNYLFGHQGIG